jgi:hypothetical protein
MAFYSNLIVFRLNLVNQTVRKFFVTTYKITDSTFLFDLISYKKAYKNLSVFSARHFQTSLKSRSVFDPLQPKKTETKSQANEFFSKEKQPLEEKGAQGTLGRMVKNLMAPKPLSFQFREKFNLSQDYKLIYFMPNERFVLMNFVILNITFPIFLVVMVIFAYGEYTGASQFEKSFEQPREFMLALTVWFTLLTLLARTHQKTTVFRIYHNEKTNQFALFRYRGLMKFQKDEFTQKNVQFKIDSQQDTAWSLLQKNMSKTFGNMKINGKSYNVDFKLFKSEDSLQKLIGTKAYAHMKAKSQI